MRRTLSNWLRAQATERVIAKEKKEAANLRYKM